MTRKRLHHVDDAGCEGRSLAFVPENLYLVCPQLSGMKNGRTICRRQWSA